MERGAGDGSEVAVCTGGYPFVPRRWWHSRALALCPVLGFGKVVYTLLYLKWVTNKDLLYSRGNSAQCHVAAWMGEGFGGSRAMDIGICMVESLC